MSVPTMNLYTKQQKLAYVIPAYKSQYPKNRQFADGTWSDEKLKQLLALDPITESGVIAIIGNDTWTSHRCDICRTDCDVLVEMKTRAHEEYGPSVLCRECLQKALDLLNTAQ